jgi:hypothetical protein
VKILVLSNFLVRNSIHLLREGQEQG